MRAEAARTVTLVLDEDEARALHEWAVRAVRLTDGGYSCPMPERLCLHGRDLADVIGATLGLADGFSTYPQSDAERRATERPVV